MIVSCTALPLSRVISGLASTGIEEATPLSGRVPVGEAEEAVPDAGCVGVGMANAGASVVQELNRMTQRSISRRENDTGNLINIWIGPPCFPGNL
jgi:hypothetical protein